MDDVHFYSHAQRYSDRRLNRGTSREGLPAASAPIAALQHISHVVMQQATLLA
jgi:hypothetical protein